MTCPKCGESARFVDYRSKDITSLVGEMRLSRPYYHCKHCHTGIWPWDAVLCLSDESLTRGAEEVVAMLGTLDSFGTVAESVLPKAAGLSLSESTVERATENAGKRLGAWLEAGEVFGPQKPFDWNCDAEGKTCAYVSLDATGILMQGPNGAKADGRMVEVGMIFDPQPRTPNAPPGVPADPQKGAKKDAKKDAKKEAKDDEDICRPCDGVRYLAGHYTLEELGQQLRRQGAHVGMDSAEVHIALTDAGQGFERFIDVNFPRAVKIVDFRHASEYVNDFAKAYRPGKDGDGLATTWCHMLKHEGGLAFLKVLQSLEASSIGEAAQASFGAALSYFRNHSGRMDYPTYLKKGWQIGTGGVESACKNVVNHRLNKGGMRWGEEGSDAVSHLRGLFCSSHDQWSAFWAHKPRPKTVNAFSAA